MNPYDNERVQAVWQRVIGRQEDATDLRQSLTEMILAEHASAQAYRQMAEQTKVHGTLLRRMAMEEQQHSRKLTVLYDLLYGQWPQLSKPHDTQRLSFREAVRHSFRGELKATETYEEAARSWPMHRSFFEQLAHEERRHSQNLQRMAHQRVHSPQLSRGK